MHSYSKILNLFKFHEPTKGRTVEFACPEFEYLRDCEWLFTEKVDGTNIRVIFDAEGKYEIRGRTDKAPLHSHLLAAIKEIMDKVEFTSLTIYGEGYGPGINKGGAYRAEKSFVAFDVFIHVEEDGYYLPRLEAEQLCRAQSIPFVPIKLIGKLREAYWAVQRGLESEWGKFWAEGLVGVPMIPVRGIKGERLIVKIKHRDYFEKTLVALEVS